MEHFQVLWNISCVLGTVTEFQKMNFRVLQNNSSPLGSSVILWKNSMIPRRNPRVVLNNSMFQGGTSLLTGCYFICWRHQAEKNGSCGGGLHILSTDSWVCLGGLPLLSVVSTSVTSRLCLCLWLCGPPWPLVTCVWWFFAPLGSSSFWTSQFVTCWLTILVSCT